MRDAVVNPPRRTDDAHDEHVGARCRRLRQLLVVPRRVMPFTPTISAENGNAVNINISKTARVTRHDYLRVINSQVCPSQPSRSL